MIQYKKTSASGKVILLGEHSVLQGGGAIAIPFGHDACVLEVTQAPEMSWHIEPQADSEVITKLKQDWRLVMMGTSLENKNFEIKVQFNLPAGSGFGLSASWSVALVRYAQQVLDWPEDQCLETLQKLEDTHHGQASGIDHLTIWLAQPQGLFEGEVFPVEIDTSQFAVFFTGRTEESTAEMINRVKGSSVEPPFLNKKIIQEINELTSEDLALMINDFGRWLESVGAVNPALGRQFEDFRRQGGAVKICGAGGYQFGSGAAIAWHKDSKVLAAFLQEFEVFSS